LSRSAGKAEVKRMELDSEVILEAILRLLGGGGK
jgi:hypothetical protein